ncbi:unnamed protein product, partial [marine sediment metagenome]
MITAPTLCRAAGGNTYGIAIGDVTAAEFGGYYYHLENM